MSLKKWSQEDLDNWSKWQDDNDPEAGNIIVAKYLPLVEFVVHRLAVNLPHSVHKDDLMSFGFNGLLDAIKKFDVSRGLQFETYATFRIRGAVIDGLRQSDWLPRSVRERARKIEEAYAILEQEKMRSVSEKEVAEYLGVTPEEVNQIIVDTSLSTVSSIDEPIYDEENHQTERVNMILNERAELPEVHIHQQFIKDTLTEVINRLPEKEKIVISLFYFEELNLTEIAEVLDLSTSRISQLHSKAMLRLKSSLVRYQDMMRSI